MPTKTKAKGGKQPSAAEDKADIGVNYDSSSTESDEGDLDLAATAAELGEGSADDSDVVDVDFDFVDPRPIHFKSVRRLLTHYLPGEEARFDSSGLADLIVGQASVGTIVASGEEPDDAYAFATVLNLERHAEQPCIKAIAKYLLAKAPSAAARAAVKAAFEGKNTALLLSERMVNMPPEIAPTLYKCLLDDLEWARKNEISDEHKAQFNFNQVLVLSPAFLDKVPRAQPDESAAAAAAAAGSKRPRQADAGDSDEEGDAADEEDGMLPPPRKLQYDVQEQYMHFEEELLAARATVNFSFPVTAAAAAAGAGQGAPGASSSSSAAAAGGDGDAPSYSNGVGALRRVLVVPASHLPRAAAGMETLLASAQEAAEEEAADLQRLAQEIGQALPASKRARKLVITPLVGGGAAAAKK